MDVKEAVALARSWILDLYADEQITNLGLEEVNFDESKKIWRVTLGFSRPWNTQRDALSAMTGAPVARRTFKVVSVRDRDRKVVSMIQRDAA